MYIYILTCTVVTFQSLSVSTYFFHLYLIFVCVYKHDCTNKENNIIGCIFNKQTARIPKAMCTLSL